MIDSPCHYCEFRHKNCHDKCEVYSEYKAQLAEVSKVEKENSEADTYIYKTICRKRKMKNAENNNR